MRNECARQMHQVAECVRHSIGDPLLNARRFNRRQRSRTADALRGLGRSLRFFGRRWLSRVSLSLGNWFDWRLSRLPRGFCRAVFTSGFFFESIVGVDGCVSSLDTDSVGVAFGFGASARGGVEPGEAGGGGAVAIGGPSGLIACAAADGAAVFGASARGGVESGKAGGGGAVAIGGPSGLIACAAADGAAVFGASARGGVESGEAGVGGAVAIGGPSGLIACAAADGAAVFGASARGGVESGEAGGGGAVAIGAPSGPILCEVTSVGAWFGRAGIDAGAAELGEPEGSSVCSLCGLTCALGRGDRGLRRRQVWSSVHEDKAHTDCGGRRQREPASYQFPASGTGPRRLLKIGPRSNRRLGVRLGGDFRFPCQSAIAEPLGLGNWTWLPSTRRAAER